MNGENNFVTPLTSPVTSPVSSGREFISSHIHHTQHNQPREALLVQVKQTTNIIGG